MIWLGSSHHCGDDLREELECRVKALNKEELALQVLHGTKIKLYNHVLMHKYTIYMYKLALEVIVNQYIMKPCANALGELNGPRGTTISGH